MGGFKVIILGSGLAGTLLANGLVRNDIDVAVYDRLKRDSKREGYQIRLGGHALKGFRACLEPDQIQTIISKFGRANGSIQGAPIIHDRDFNVILDLTKFPTYEKSAPINRVLLRDTLAELLDKKSVLTYDKQFERYSIQNPGTPKEQVRVYFTDGTSEDCDIVIAADGNQSTVNKQIGLNNIQSIETHISLLAKCELPTSRYKTLSPALRKEPVMAFSNNVALYFCAYLPDKVKEGEESDEDVGFDDSLSSCFLGIHMPVASVPSNLGKLSTKEQWDYVRTSLRGWAPEYHEMVDLLEGQPTHVYQGRAAIKPSLNWRSKVQKRDEPEKGHPRVWLIGDAMHAMLPNRGMGGNSAMRDTATALPLLKELAQLAGKDGTITTKDAEQKVQQYEAEMIPRAFEWVKKSGGTNVMPIDSSRWFGSMIIRLLRAATSVAWWFYYLTGKLNAKPAIDDAPELRS